MPPTLLWPLSASRPRSFAPARKAASSDPSRRKKGTFMRERQAGATRFSYSGRASSAAYSRRDFSSASASIAATPPWASRCLNTRPAM